MVMARLLRQRLLDYVKDVNTASADYTQAATTYNSAIQAAGSGTPSVIKDATGKEVVVGGKVDDQLRLISGSIRNLSDLPDVNNGYGGMYAGVPMYARDAQGNVAKYMVQSVTSAPKTAPQPTGDPFTDALNRWGFEISSQQSGPTEPTTSFQWVKSGGNLAIIPDEPVVAEVKDPNLTVSNIKELENPSADPAGLNLQQSYGLQGKSQLAGDVANSRFSAFADPEDPNNLAERGILARTLAGQLG